VLGVKKRRELARKIASHAKSKYGELKRRKIRPALDQLVLSLIWQHASTRRAAGALRDLQAEFVDWNEARVSTQAEVAGVMGGSDWAAAAGLRIREALRSLFDAHNTVDLDFLSEMTTTQARTFLQGLPGVSRDIADEVLLMSMAVDVLPVSEAAARMCHRLGLIANDRVTLSNQKGLADLWEPDLYPALMFYFADEANGTCRHDKPRCVKCALKALCVKEEV
jgi:endonuclease-3